MVLLGSTAARAEWGWPHLGSHAWLLRQSDVKQKPSGLTRLESVGTDPRELLEALAARCEFPDGELQCAVSGGADSLALLALAATIRPPTQVTAFHVDHQLRPGSGKEAANVAYIASALGVGFVSLTINVGIGPNVEARARSLRYEALPVGVCTGHTLDDVAETVIANLIRGAGLDGLSPMVGSSGSRTSPTRTSPTRTSTRRPNRPLLGLRRSETEAICSAYGWTPLDDPMNHDLGLLRSSIRHRVLPMLSEVSGRDVAPLLARTARVSSEDLAVLEALASELDPCDALSLAAAPPALARRALRRWIIDSGVNEGQPPSLAVLERIMAVVLGRAVSTEIGGGWTMLRTAQRLRLEQTL
jgi:tRNA(Ile)-lysidine synthase